MYVFPESESPYKIVNLEPNSITASNLLNPVTFIFLKVKKIIIHN